MTSRFAEVVAGTGVEQTARLIVDYFPGDGEAIVGLRARTPSQDARLVRVLSARGQVLMEEGGFFLDYSEDPIGDRLVDTVEVQLVTTTQSTAFDLTLSTNVDTASASGHRMTVTLAAIPPLRASLSVEPAHVYPGESIEFRVSADRAADEDRQLESIRAEWPAGIIPVGDPVATRQGADALELRQPVRVRRDIVGSLPLSVSAAGAGLLASPIGTKTVAIAPVPTFHVEVPDDDVHRGEVAHLGLHWRNDTAEAIPVASLAATAAAGFARARLIHRDVPGGTGGVLLEADEEKGSVVVSVSRENTLAPGEDVVVGLDVTPLASGPFTIEAQFLPADRATVVSLGRAVLQVTAPEAGLAPALSLVETDLELARGGLELELRPALQSLPLARGASLHLSSSRSDDGNWVIEGLLTDLLLEHGVRVMADSAATDVLHYRLADARVVYSSSGSGWNLLDTSKRRDARMEVFLRLEDADGRVLWVDRVASNNGESKAREAASWLGGAKGVDQVSVIPDHRAIEISLSGLIVGGLFFVFFVP